MGEYSLVWSQIIRRSALLTAACVLAGGCSFISSGGDETVTETTATTETPTTAADTAATETTVEVLEPEPDAPAENTEPVPANAPIEQILSIVEDMHGPTSNITAQMNRLVAYPDLPTPTGAYLAGIYARVATTFDDESRYTVWSEADFYADGTAEDLALFYETQLPPLGWNLTKTANDTRFDGAPITELEFELPNSSFELRQTLEVTVVEDPELPELLVETRFIGPETDDRTFFDRYLGWYDPTALPDGGAPSSGTIDTNAGEGRTTLMIETEYRYADGSGPELLSELTDLAAGSGLEPAETFRSDAVALAYPPLEEYLFTVYETGDNVTVSIEGETKFINAELETAEVVAEDKPTDPLPDFATAEQIEAVVKEIHGPTTDIAAQMNRLGPFPALPTPIGSTVVELTTALSPVIGGDDLLAQRGEVLFRVAGTKEDTLLYFETQTAALGWSEASRADESEDDGLTTKTTVEYNLPDIDSGTRPPFELVVTDDVDSSDVTVRWTYREFIGRNQANTERWLGWQEDAPLPDTGTIRDLGVSTDGLFGQAIFYFTEWEFPVAEAALRTEIEGLVSGSAYGLDEEGPVESRLYLTHPYFDNAYVSFFSVGDDETRVDLNTQRPLS